MEWMNQIAQLGGWAWIAAGFLLIVIELLVAGNVIVWFGIAALIVGMASFIQPIGTHIQWILFGILSVLSVVIWRRYASSQKPEQGSGYLNKRAHHYLGRVFTADDGFENGEGRLRIDDTIWIARGADIAAGAKVRIVGAEGNVLLVETIKGQS